MTDRLADLKRRRDISSRMGTGYKDRVEALDREIAREEAKAKSEVSQ